MSYEINPAKVAGVVKECDLVVGNGVFNPGEIIVGLTELLGRVIVKTCDTPISMGQAAEVVANHLQKTLYHGAVAKGFGQTEEPSGSQIIHP
jgi:hypothetical protein